MVALWEQLSAIGFSNVILSLLIVVALTCAIIKGFQELLKILGLELKSERLKHESEERIKKLEDRVVTLEGSAKKFNEDRVHDREQSFNYQHEYMEIVNGITQKQDEILNRVDELYEQNRKYQLADMRETLLQAHRYYTGDSNPLKMWTEIEHHAWNEQYDVYTSAKGNSYVEETVKPEMDSLKIVYLNDYDGMSKLMASRSKNCN